MRRSCAHGGVTRERALVTFPWQPSTISKQKGFSKSIFPFRKDGIAVANFRESNFFRLWKQSTSNMYKANACYVDARVCVNKRVSTVRVIMYTA